MNLGLGLSSTTFTLKDNSLALLALSLVLFCSSILICIITSSRDICFLLCFMLILLSFQESGKGLYKVVSQKGLGNFMFLVTRSLINMW